MASRRPFFLKDKDDNRIDISIDWSEFLDVDEVVTSVWTITPALELVEVASSFVGNVCTVFLDNGEAGTNYVVTNTITTTQPRDVQRSVTVAVREL